ncbi:MAG: carboxymuconolactone decarboxylase family protein [Thermodesulfobacteriota bacterium]|jgi:alkylhydroperoxidase family enzyme
MSRVGLLDKEQAAPEIREMFQKMEENGSRVLNIFKVMAHCPQVGYQFLRLGNSILFKGTVPSTLRELAILRVGQISQAKYEWTHHVPVALRMGVREEQIEALHDWENSGKFNEQEQAVLRYTDEVTKNIRVKDDTFAGVRSFLNEEGVVELTTTIGYYGMVCRILEALHIELESPPR